MNPLRLAPCRTALLLAALFIGSATQAGVSATVTRNPDLSYSDVNFGARAEVLAALDAAGGGAWAVATRDSVFAYAEGLGQQPPGAYGARATSGSGFELWNLATNSALDPALAATLGLSFNFHLQGQLTVGPVSLSAGSIDYDVALFSSGVDQMASHLTVIYGPVPPFPTTGYSVQGNSSLRGEFNHRFSLLFQNRSAGLLQMSMMVSASNQVTAKGDLVLDSINLASGLMPGDGLGIRISETGLILPVSAVPEPQTWALLLAGLAAVSGVARRRKGNAQPA